jgi:hypothetical protein
LLDKLQFQLHRSLNYEHGVGNITHRQCNSDVAQQDEDLAALKSRLDDIQGNIDALDTRKEGLNIMKGKLEEEIQQSQDQAVSLTHRIQGRTDAKEARENLATEQTQTLESMRTLMTEGGFKCHPGVMPSPVFEPKHGVECSGELLDITLTTSKPAECQPLCGFGCKGFSFNPVDGCRFFSSLRGTVGLCASGASSCSCFTKQE